VRGGGDELWWRWWRKACVCGVCVVLLDTFLPSGLRKKEPTPSSTASVARTSRTPRAVAFWLSKAASSLTLLYVSSIAALSMHRVALVGCLPALAESSYPPRRLATKSEQPTWPTRVRTRRAGPPSLCSLMPRCRAHCPLLARTVAQRRCLLDTRHECLHTAQISLTHKRNTHHAIHHLQPKQRQRSPRSSGRQAKGPSRPLLQLAKPQSPCGRGREDRLGQVTRAAHPRPPPSQTWGRREMPQGLAHRK
jgi:hypothetical protein